MSERVPADASAGPWWVGETVNLLRDMLPEWSAYREDVA